MFEYVNSKRQRHRTKNKAAPAYKPKETYEVLDIVELIVEIEYVIVEPLQTSTEKKQSTRTKITALNQCENLQYP